MKRMKMFFITLTFIICIIGYPLKSVFAIDTSIKVNDEGFVDNIDSTGLIDSISASISAGTKTIYLSARTYGSDVMASIGFKNIEIQYSSDGVSGWLMEYSLADDLATNSIVNSKINEAHGVHGGYYYRVVLDHYAKETGFWFPGTESIPNTSNVVWVPRG